MKKIEENNEQYFLKIIQFPSGLYKKKPWAITKTGKSMTIFNG
jgi:hypothetical protein